MQKNSLFFKNIWSCQKKAVPLHSLSKTKQVFLAQLVEQLTLNQWVQGSSPWEDTKKDIQTDVFFCTPLLSLSPSLLLLSLSLSLLSYSFSVASANVGRGGVPEKSADFWGALQRLSKLSFFILPIARCVLISRWSNDY